MVRTQAQALSEVSSKHFIFRSPQMEPHVTLLNLPPSLYAAFIASLSLAIVLVLTRHWHGRFSMDGLTGVQKMHNTPTPRIGGVAIFLGCLVAWWVARLSHAPIVGALLLAGLPAFVFGLAEDLTKTVGVMSRLLATMASGVLGWLITGVSITHVGLPVVDTLLSWPVVSVVFTAFAVGGIANSVNIVDGFNGLASGFVVIALGGLAAMAGAFGDTALALTCTVVAAAVLGFWLVNWPWGKLFLGDGGSYFGGFALAWASVLMLERHTSVSAFAIALVCVHPITEVLFSIYRRTLREDNPGQPDRLHLHSLLMRRVVSPMLTRMGCDDIVQRAWRNPATGLLLALMSLPPVVLAYVFRDQQIAAALCMAGFMLGYVSIYARVVRFHWCSPLAFLFVRPLARVGGRSYA